ncbi:MULTISPECIES: dihydrofolate reductase family protein [Actinosynnema]|uniref:dihydrofolate reductase family protein n=1 Tax=Actinosynnema TaxID=40566 RepID=UPI0020A54360|nr:dihydrofolate reductase family protein [Actinosynnema pretiosum]MCP2098625.1 Dihydrofolate reductase [Actinosynnema pretiosum]
MRKLVVTAFQSLDGVVQGPGGPDEDRSGGFEQGGWLVPFHEDGLGELMAGYVRRAGALLLGRRTYDIFATSWPLAPEDDPIGERFNAIPKHVVTSSPLTPEWRGASVLSGELAVAVAALKAEEGGEIQVHGSGTLVRALLERGLVDELQVITFPVLVGSGKRLFGEAPVTFELSSVDRTATGAVVANYVNGAAGLAHGALGPETGNW